MAISVELLLMPQRAAISSVKVGIARVRLRRGGGPDMNAPMASAFRLMALPKWRMACIALACAAAGGGLRWGFRKQIPVRADSALTSPAAPVSKPPVPL